MTTLRLTMPDGEHQLPDSSPLYLWAEGDHLRVTPDSPPPHATARLGYLSPMLGRWWLQLSEADLPGALLLDGLPVSAGRLELPRSRANLSLTGASAPAAAPASHWVDGGEVSADQRDGDAAPPPRPEPPVEQSPRTSWLIGPVGSRADIQIADPQVRVNHGRLQPTRDGRWWVTSEAGPIFVGGMRTRWAALDEGDSFVVGQTAVTVSPRRAAVAPPVEVSAGRGLSVDLDRVTVRRKGNTLLDDVTLHVPAGEVVAVIGPSGAGKTSLVKVLLGEYEPDSGQVCIGSAHGALRQQVRYVPQSESDDLYPSLTVYETLMVAARLRWAPATRAAALDQQVRQVIEWLGLTERTNALVADLSGGQRRRVSIGIELVGRPQLLLLDEPTSGLDLGKDREIMKRLGAVSKELHCTIIVVTHTVTHLADADADVVVLAKGGQLAYVGSPDGAAERNGYPGWADWLTELDTPRVRAAAGLAAVHGVPRSAPGNARAGRSVHGLAAVAGLQVHGFRTALCRQLTLLWRRGPRSLAALSGLPLLGVLAAIAASPHGLQSGDKMTQALAVLVTIAALTGASLTYHDLVSEGAILRRDWRVGIGAASLLLAKVVTVAAVCVLLSAAMTTVFAPRGLPPATNALPPAAALFLTLFSVMVASAGLGLVISSLSRSLERAVTWSTALAILQVALNGSLFELTGLWRISASVLPARQGFAAMASYGNMNTFRPPGAYHDALWTGGAAHFWQPLAICGLILVLSTSGAIVAMTKVWRTGRSAS